MQGIGLAAVSAAGSVIRVKANTCDPFTAYQIA